MKKKGYFKKAVEYFEKGHLIKSHDETKIDEPINEDLRAAKVLREEMLEEVINLKKLLLDFHNKELERLSQQEKDLYYRFLDYYAYCPICSNRNDKFYLRKFYFDKEAHKRILRTKLLDLMVNENKDKKIKVGIPCCKCYENFFRKDEVLNNPS